MIKLLYYFATKYTSHFSCGTDRIYLSLVPVLHVEDDITSLRFPFYCQVKRKRYNTAIIKYGGHIMNKSELIAGMAAESGLTKADAEKALGSFLHQVEKALKEGDRVRLMGFGTFEVKARAERTGRNPRTRPS